MYKYLLSLVFAAGLIVLPGAFAQAGSCHEPVTHVEWTGHVNSGVSVRNLTCMEESVVVGTLSGGSTVSIVGDAHGWYKVKLSNGTTGFVWNSFITVTSKSSTPVTEVKKVEKVEVKKTEVKKVEKKTVTNSEKAALKERLKGHILLQVEAHGEAWYVHPDDGKRFYMKDGETAYDMMREFGLGITNADLAKVQAGDAVLIAQLKGKILLQVEEHGEAFYIHPEDGSAHYLKDGPAAYKVMRELSLGVTNSDLNKIDSDDFDAFKAKKKAIREGKAIEPSLNGTINLSASVVGAAEGNSSNGSKVLLTWTVSEVDTSLGFKVVYSDDPNPTYPDDNPKYLSDGSTRSFTKTGLSAGTYNFRICQYTGNGCGLYSNNVTVTVDGSTPNTTIDSTSGTIILEASVVNAAEGNSSGSKVLLSWSVDGVDTSQGFKVVYSKDANPTYPEDNPTYIGDGSLRSHTKTGLGAGTYHFRVCQYTGDSACGVYSNDVVVTVGSSTSVQTNSGTDGTTLSQVGIVPAGVDLKELNEYWLGKINALRAERGLRQLVLDQRWVDTAAEWAGYMGVNDFASHDRPDGKSMHQWIDTKGLPFTERHSPNGWSGNYFTENIAWGIMNAGTTVSAKKVLDDTLAFYLSEADYNGPHYRTIYHEDWNTVGVGFHFAPQGNGYKVYVAMHYGSLVI